MLRILKQTLILPVKFYKNFISPALPPTCRFHPTCSSYALEALEVHGPFKGSILAVRRISRCHPFNPGGIDPVPGSSEITYKNVFTSKSSKSLEKESKENG